jgi:L-amino acid N-acyltransferase YncA
MTDVVLHVYISTAEVTLHLRRDQRRKGYGSQLLQAIIAHAQQVGLKNLIAVISGDNDEGLAFFKKFGFETAGHFKEVGWKNGKWLDLVQLQLSL